MKRNSSYMLSVGYVRFLFKCKTIYDIYVYIYALLDKWLWDRIVEIDVN